MKDPRIDKLVKVLIEHSTHLKAGEKVLIEAIDVPDTIMIALIRQATQIGATPLVTLKQGTVLRELYSRLDDTGMQLTGELEAARMKQVDAYIAIRGSNNINELSDVPSENTKRYQKYWWKPVHIDIRVPQANKVGGVTVSERLDGATGQ